MIRSFSDRDTETLACGQRLRRFVNFERLALRNLALSVHTDAERPDLLRLAGGVDSGAGSIELCLGQGFLTGIAPASSSGSAACEPAASKSQSTARRACSTCQSSVFQLSRINRSNESATP